MDIQGNMEWTPTWNYDKRIYIYTGWLGQPRRLIVQWQPKHQRTCEYTWNGLDITGWSQSGIHGMDWMTYVRKAWYDRTKHVWEWYYRMKHVWEWYYRTKHVWEWYYRTKHVWQQYYRMKHVWEPYYRTKNVREPYYRMKLCHITTTWATDLRLQRAVNPWRTLSQSWHSHYESHMSNNWTSHLHY